MRAAKLESEPDDKVDKQVSNCLKWSPMTDWQPRVQACHGPVRILLETALSASCCSAREDLMVVLIISIT